MKVEAGGLDNLARHPKLERNRLEDPASEAAEAMKNSSTLREVGRSSPSPRSAIQAYRDIQLMLV